VRNLGVAAGINKDLLATPAIALGAYVATPLEIAGAYTTFSNGGQYVEPRFVLAVNDAAGHTLWRNPAVTRPVLDPRVAYLMVSLLESVINNGTGAGVRSRGFALPAAGKTGTSHDGWFAGFTSELMAVVWIGYDDDRELNLSGANSALLVWTEFMKQAANLAAYRDAKPFEPPPGVVTVPIQMSASLAGSGASVIVRNEFFIDGTQPQGATPGKGLSGILSRLFHPGSSSTLPAAVTAPPAVLDPSGSPAGSPPEPPPGRKKEGIMKKFISIFKGKNSKPDPPAEPEKKPQPEG